MKCIIIRITLITNNELLYMAKLYIIEMNAKLTIGNYSSVAGKLKPSHKIGIFPLFYKFPLTPACILAY